jgi:hypothetical protein
MQAAGLETEDAVFGRSLLEITRIQKMVILPYVDLSIQLGIFVHPLCSCPSEAPWSGGT